MKGWGGGGGGGGEWRKSEKKRVRVRVKVFPQEIINKKLFTPKEEKKKIFTLHVQQSSYIYTYIYILKF